MRDYLEIKQEELLNLKNSHSLNLKAYKTQLELNKDPELDEKLTSRANKYNKQEERFESYIIQRNKDVKKRIWEIDFLRALVIFGMLVFHFLNNFRIFFPDLFNSEAYFANGFLNGMYNGVDFLIGSKVASMLRYIGIMVLAILIGINTRFSKDNWKRFLMLFLFAIGLNIFYAIGHAMKLMNYSVMNIIMSYALGLLLYCICADIFKKYEKNWKWICLGIGSFLLVGWIILRLCTLSSHFEIGDNLFLTISGDSGRIINFSTIDQLNLFNWFEVIIGTKQFGSEWVGMFPNAAFIFIGAFIGQTVYKDKKSIFAKYDKENDVTTNEKLNRKTAPFLFFGHHTVLIYLLHQPIFTLLALIIIGLFMGIPLGF